MGQTPQLDSMRQDAQLKAIKGNSPSSSKQDKDDSIDASTRYEFAKRQYGKSKSSEQKPIGTTPAVKTTAPSNTSNKPTSPSSASSTSVPSYKKGGMVKKTGLAKLHAGEKVIPRNKVASVGKAMKKNSGKKAS